MVCEQRLFLGQFFSAPDDRWLSFHFYSSCLEKEQEGCRRPTIEARASVSRLLLLQGGTDTRGKIGKKTQYTRDNIQDKYCSLFFPVGELEQGKLQAELCIEQATESGLLDVIGRPLRFRAYKTLWGIHSRLADLSLAAADYGEALTLLLEGYSMATECTFQKVSMFVYKIRRIHIESDRIADVKRAQKYAPLNTFTHNDIYLGCKRNKLSCSWQFFFRIASVTSFGYGNTDGC